MTFPPIYNTRQMANYARETFIWRWRSALRLPRPLPEDFHVLCLRFSLAEAEGAAAEFELLEIVQATFYAMLLNEAVELGVPHEYTVESMKSSLVGLRWSPFEVWMDCMDCPLRGAQLYQPADEVEVRGSQDGYEEGSGSAGPPTPSSDEEETKLCFAPSFVLPRSPFCEYSSTPSILSLEVEVTYPWEITIANYMTDFQVRRMAKTKSTPCIRSLDELLAEGTQGNPCSAPPQSNQEAKVASTSSSASSRMGSSGSSSRHSLRSPSSSEASLGLGKSVLKRKGRALAVTEIVAEGSEFPGAPTRSDPPDFVTIIEKKSKVKHWKYDFLFLRRELDQATARLTVFKTRDTTPKQVAADTECMREEERQRLITQ
ncbi:hypothetical protein Cgig2_033549 [Carnegiea gigantea]|uniref:Uncharacterized protein n=1 Tax=Carnegiea gigantea TaxID=171969 RepID=A0A9Q1Q7B7_9CARY|nr:hypothetical protein Cgig2_033549 [Carnegiea gigantea]